MMQAFWSECITVGDVMSRLLDEDIVGYAHGLAAAYSDHPDRDAITVNVADWMLYIQ